LAALLPGAVREALQPAAAAVFGMIALIPPQSFAGTLFYGSFAPLPGLLGEFALAAHAALWGLPWLVLAWLVARAPRDGHLAWRPWRASTSRRA
jgi:hypothetical protein